MKNAICASGGGRGSAVKAHIDATRSVRLEIQTSEDMGAVEVDATPMNHRRTETALYSRCLLLHRARTGNRHLFHLIDRLNSCLNEENGCPCCRDGRCRTSRRPANRNMSRFTLLFFRILRLLLFRSQFTGPLPVVRYMRSCLGHPTQGYYTRNRTTTAENKGKARCWSQWERMYLGARGISSRVRNQSNLWRGMSPTIRASEPY